MRIYRTGARFEDMATNHFLIVLKAPVTKTDTIQLVDVITDAHIELPFDRFCDNTRYRAMPDDALIRLPDGSFLMGEEIEAEMGVAQTTFAPLDQLKLTPPAYPQGANIIYPKQFLKAHPAPHVVPARSRDYHPIERLALIQGRLEALAMSHFDVSVEVMAISSMLGDFKSDLQAELSLATGA